MKRFSYLLLICCLLIINTTGCSKNVEIKDGRTVSSLESKVGGNLRAETILINDNNKTASSENINIAAKQSKEELYQDVFATLLTPYIQEAINNYYKKYLTISPIYSPAYVEILNIERPMGYRTFSFLIKLQVRTYVGPHIDIGVDQLTIGVHAEDKNVKVKVEKFEHIKSYFDELPPNLKSIVIE